MSAAEGKPAFALAGVGAWYEPRRGSGKARTDVLRGLTCDIPHGETLAILGPSGAGKSTLLALLGLIGDRGERCGSVAFDSEHFGRPVEYSALTRAECERTRLHSFGFVLQSSNLLPAFTALHNLAMPLALQGWSRRSRTERAGDLLAEYDRFARTRGEADDEDGGGGSLAAKGHRYPYELSQGERQRFAALRAIVADPQVVFADEPTSNLDPRSTAAMFEILARWKSGGFSFQAAAPKVRPRTLLLVSHDLRTARAQADRFLLLRPDCGPAESFAGGEWHQHAADLRTQLGWVETERDGGR